MKSAHEDTIRNAWAFLVFRIPAASSEAKLSIIGELTRRANQHKLLGWVRPESGGLTGRILYPRSRLYQAAAEGVLKNLGVQEEELCHDESIIGVDLVRKLKQFRILPKMTKMRAAPALFKFSYGHGGKIRGYAYSPIHSANDLVVKLFHDGRQICEAAPLEFRLDLLDQGFGTGECGFSLKVPEELCDGIEREYRMALFARDAPASEWLVEKTFKFKSPCALSVAAIWRGRDRSDGFMRLRNDIVANGLERFAEDVLDDLAQHPEHIFRDFGIVEHFARKGAHFPTFQERLISRFRAEIYRRLIVRFNTKSYTKQYCQERGIRTAKTLLTTTSVGEIEAFAFPDHFVLKPSEGSTKCTFVMHSGIELLSKRRLRLEEIVNAVREHKTLHPDAGYIVEELNLQRGSAEPIVPVDYKLHVFGGLTRIIHADDRNVFSSRDCLYRQQGWFSRNWDPTPARIRQTEEESLDFRRPETLDEMLQIADRIGAECGDYVRVDLYDTEGGVSLGEVTTFSHMGGGFTEFGDAVLSQAWHIASIAQSGDPSKT